jgi:two-component system, chemotaxis family, sensor kinase Cph1
MPAQAAGTADLSLCDREPIHIPGSIQPYGVLLVVDAASLAVVAVAGAAEGRLGVVPGSGTSLVEALGEGITAAAQRVVEGGPGGFAGQVRARGSGELMDVVLHRSGRHVLVECEPADTAPPAPSAVLGQIEAAALEFERCPDMEALHAVAAREFRRLTGYDRVMVYRFLEDGAGVVVGEDTAPGMHAFMNHHFPATDIPQQARALYIRNTVRVIPDVDYQPAPLRPDIGRDEPLDMSDCGLRSVSPVHLAYLRNMGVMASASMSIVRDGVLWGLIACHNQTPRVLGYDVRAACRTLCGMLSRQIRAREETEIYRERIRLRSFEDDIVALLSRDGSLDDALSNHIDEVRRMFNADGVAVLRGRDLVTSGRHPGAEEIRAVANWVLARDGEVVFSSHHLSSLYEASDAFRRTASGLLTITLSATEPWVVLWFRAEQIQIIDWAGNPHKNEGGPPSAVLTPRASFAAWSETVRGFSRRWTLAELEAAGRLRNTVAGIWHNRTLGELNQRLMNTISEKDLLLQQKQFLIGEVNHRVQNSLQLVSSFLSMQARASEDPALQQAIEEARRRLSAVSLVHRRLYRADQFEAVDAARYIDELLDEQLDSMGEDWRPYLSRKLAPVMISPDRAVSLGLILAELVTNANKYAYRGEAGPLFVGLSEDRASFRLTVHDRGVGRMSERRGFGSRMMDALVRQLHGELISTNKTPGLETVLTAPIQPYNAPAPGAQPSSVASFS